MTRSLAALVLVAGCGGAEPATAGPAAGCDGDHLISRQEDVVAIAACGRVDGSVTIRGAAPLDLAVLTPLEAVGGDLTIGPTFALDTVVVDGVREVGGALRVVSNGLATGIFLPRLERAGAIEIAANGAAAGVSMPALVRIDRDLVVEDNPGLEHLDAGALAHIGGAIRIEGNPGLATVEVPAALRDRSPHW